MLLHSKIFAEEEIFILGTLNIDSRKITYPKNFRGLKFDFILNIQYINKQISITVQGKTLVNTVK